MTRARLLASANPGNGALPCPQQQKECPVSAICGGGSAKSRTPHENVSCRHAYMPFPRSATHVRDNLKNRKIIKHYGCLFVCFTRKKCIKERPFVISIERTSCLIYANSLDKKYLKLKLIGLDGAIVGSFRLCFKHCKPVLLRTIDQSSGH